MRSFWIVAVLLLFVGVAPAQETNRFLMVEWPGQDVFFVIRKKGISIFSAQEIPGFTFSLGQPNLLPYENDAFPGIDFAPDARAGAPSLLTIIGDQPFILDSAGWAVIVPTTKGKKSQLLIQSVNGSRPLVAGFSNENGFIDYFVYHEHTLFRWKSDHVGEVTLSADKKSFEHGDQIYLLENARIDADIVGINPTGSRVLSGRLSEVYTPNEKPILQGWKINNFDFTLPLYEKHPLHISNAKSLPAPTKVAKQTAPPAVSGLDRLRAQKSEKADLLAWLKKAVFGQDLAIGRIASQYSEALINKTEKPKVLVAMGPSGSGKTHTAERLSERLHDGHIFEISGNEYRAHAGALDYTKLWGGKGGGGEGALVKFAKEHPDGFTLVINEGEKMHPDIWLMFMEFFDTGMITDSSGTKVEVKNLWVVITSNRGATRMFPPSSKNWKQSEIDRRLKELTQEELANYFQQRDGLKDSFQLPPEIIKRIDEFVAFGPTSQKAAVLMAKFAEKSLNDFYREEYNISIDFDEHALHDVALSAWGLSNDARTIGRAVRAIMKDVLEEGVDELELQGGESIKVAVGFDAGGRKHYVASANDKSIRLNAAVNPLESPLLDSEFRKRLGNMKGLMNEIVIGQEEVLNDIGDAVLSHFGRGQPSRPFSAYLLGVSGNGKTETGRALSKVIYDTDSRFAVIPMGNVNDTSAFENLFGSAAKYQGGDVERAFEKVLRENPNGAVIILDEISNMGGGEKNRKTALFQKLYDFLEEGRYVSPIDGREYDLRKFQFILTGNDGEELFRGITSDDLLEETWQRNKNPERVREIMREAGIPNAFINRLNVIALTKPLLKWAVTTVTQKLWDRQVKEFTDVHKGIEIVAGHGFMEQLAETFFTADQGGRSVRKILEDKVGALFLHALMNSGSDFSDLSGFMIVVTLEDSITQKAYRTSRKPREVVFRSQIFKNSTLIHTEALDVSKVTPEKILLNQNDARLTAYHEAGHAVANSESDTREGMAFITIRGGSTGKLKYYGYARYEPSDDAASMNMTRQQVIARIARLYAGRKAQEMAGFKADSGWSEDLKQIRKLVTHYLTHWGLDDQLIGLPMDTQGNPQIRGAKAALFDQRMAELIRQGERLAEQRLERNWRLVRAVVAELLLRGEIKRERFQELKGRYEGTLAPALKNSRKTYRDYRSRGGRCVDLFTAKAG